jgi:hypothetical protein
LTFTDLIIAANDSKNSRGPGQWTPQACRIWREAEPQDALILEAAIAWEMVNGRRVQPADEAVVREVRRQMDQATAAVRAAKV